jgi:subtilase family serine protease
MTMNGTGASYASEVVWNWGTEYGSQYNGVGSSGGVSSYYAIPTWQATVANLTAAGGSTSYRNIPDVAANADNVYITYHNGRSEDGIGGTSCAAPIWAGFLALVNQQAAINGKPAIGFLNPALYALAAGANYSSCFHDVTSGNNTWSNSPSLFYAQTGYDLCTGLGTPGGVSLINALAGTAPPTLVVAPVSGAAAGYAGGPFVVTSQSFQLTNTPSASLSWSLVNTSLWLAFSATNGTLSPGASTTVTASLTVAATNLAVGNYTANLIFSNLTTGTSQSAVFTLQVNQPLVISPAQIAASNANFNLSWSAVSGLTYQLQYSTNLAQTNWINLGAPQLAGANLLSFSDTNALNSSPARYYRIFISP